MRRNTKDHVNSVVQLPWGGGCGPCEKEKITNEGESQEDLFFEHFERRGNPEKDRALEP